MSIERKDKQIILNMIECKCGRVLVSVHRHDFRQCECPLASMVDGGVDYLRRGFAAGKESSACFTEMSVVYQKSDDTFRMVGRGE